MVNVNADGGSLRAELLDAGGNQISGYSMNDCIPIQSNDISEIVRWKNHVELPYGKQEFRIRFQMENASLYGFYAGPEVERVEN